MAFEGVGHAVLLFKDWKQKLVAVALDQSTHGDKNGKGSVYRCRKINLTILDPSQDGKAFMKSLFIIRDKAMDSFLGIKGEEFQQLNDTETE
eukprot:CAMPEP_0183756564 /NCGR_PEP_ID=MMETSP0739-20130205/5130_1 /TAXON_ID=385413 /ORGANISM="Thalassiosira miniscula, Strain CCMP1093" /LENGTH=91 /DNA_ID=CAMNT_0025993803 /DNA_START=605 /DNA_END=880 /DNA_ORIENTATION=+